MGFKSGFPIILLPLPSRREQCEFVLRPLTHTVKDFLENIQKEDKGIERATVYNVDGSRISGSTGVDVLLQSDFKVVLNDNSYFVSVPDESKCYLDTLRINNYHYYITEMSVKPSSQLSLFSVLKETSFSTYIAVRIVVPQLYLALFCSNCLEFA